MKRFISFVVVALTVAFSSTAFAAPTRPARANRPKIAHVKKGVKLPASLKKAPAAKKHATLKRIPRRSPRAVKH